MTKRKGLTKAESFQKLCKQVEHLEMNSKVFQTIIQRFGQSFSGMEQDISSIATTQRDIQYKLLAMTEILNIDNDTLNGKIEKLQIVDFEEASEKEDAERSFTKVDVVESNSVVVFTTSTVDSKAKDILRSKVDLEEINHPEFVAAVMGKSRGDTFTTTINEAEHSVTVLDIKTKPVLPEPTTEELSAEVN